MDALRPALRRWLLRELPSIAGLVASVGALSAVLVVGGDSDAAAHAQSRGYRFHDARPFVAPAPRPVVESSVIGSDGRARVTDTTAFPFSAITAIEAYDDDGQLTETCSGAFVGPDAVLTAGHCLWDPESGRWAIHLRVVPGKDGPVEPFGSQFATDWWVPDAFIDADGDSGQDWGLIRLPDDHLARQAHWLALAILSDGELSSPGFTPTITGYPTDLGDGTMWRDSADGWAAIGAGILTYAIDTGPGESGAPIWSSAPGSADFARVVAIHTWASEQRDEPNSGVRITTSVIADLREACRQLVCTLDVGPPYITEGGTARPFRAFGPAIARGW